MKQRQKSIHAQVKGTTKPPGEQQAFCVQGTAGGCLQSEQGERNQKP